MFRQADPAFPDVRTPIWRRITALVSLGSVVVLAGVGLAAVVGMAIIAAVILVERAIG